jgi:DNA-binding helix-hairpin-helix protein with protein kinase domain
VNKGGQAEIYRVATKDGYFAVKLYSPEALRVDPTLRQRLDVAIRNGAPDNDPDFIWPFDLIALNGSPNFSGYIMPWIPERYRDVSELMRNQVSPSSRVLATVGMNLALKLQKLHQDGLCYTDLNFGNAKCNFDTGDVVVLDNDNVTTNGVPAAVQCPPNFRAPEVFRGETAPNIQTDLYSLAILLFYILMIHHPLIGKRDLQTGYSEEGQRDLYGDHPVFIFDPQDDSNRPDPKVHPNAIASWPVYPQFLRNMFTKAFTTGLHDPYARVTETEWSRAFCRLRDSILTCSQCGAENFYDVDYLQTSKGVAAPCWYCNQPLLLPPRLRMGREVSSVIVLDPKVQLFPHHVNGNKFDFSRPIAEVGTTQSLSLTNLSRSTWIVETAGDGRFEVAQGASVRLKNGTKIHFGKVEGEVKL